MSTICSAPVAAQQIARESWPSVVAATMKRRWMAYTTWRIQQAAIAPLSITDAVRGQALRGRAATGPSRWPLEPIKSQQLMSKQSTLAILAHIVRYWHKADIA